MPPNDNLPTVQQTPRPTLTAGNNVAAIVPSDVEQTWRLATIVAESEMAPKSFGKDPRKVMVAMMHGMEVGFTPMAALQSIAVINGMPSIWGDGALGLVEASGLLEENEEWIEGEGDQMTAFCRVTRRGRKPKEQRFSMADAKQAGLLGKDTWKGYTRRMLQMRARSWALRDAFADILRGLQIAEEAQDIRPLSRSEDGAYEPTPAVDNPFAARPAVEAEVIEPPPPPKDPPKAAPPPATDPLDIPPSLRRTPQDSPPTDDAEPPPKDDVEWANDIQRIMEHAERSAQTAESIREFESRIAARWVHDLLAEMPDDKRARVDAGIDEIRKQLRQGAS